MSNIKIFENEQFGKIRSIIQDDEPLFIAVDVCNALELKNVSRALSRLDGDEKGITSMNTLGGYSIRRKTHGFNHGI